MSSGFTVNNIAVLVNPKLIDNHEMIYTDEFYLLDINENKSNFVL